jgi:2-polyprenyl-3-methyl-5-hydroxy-6-metoxy-1,4-benzoquinol methylase
LAFIQKHVPLPGKRLLDVRCRLGQFMVEAAALGALPRGLDELDTSANYCRSLGFSADIFPLEDPARSLLEGEFDVVRLNNVLAHSPSPSATLAAFAERLSPNGAMFIEDPDIAYFSAWRSRTPAELLDGFPDKQTRSQAAKRMAQADRARRRRPWWRWRNSASANDGP